MVFGGCYSILGHTPTTNTFNDLWALDIDSLRWHSVATAGLRPSPRCDMGTPSTSMPPSVHITQVYCIPASCTTISSNGVSLLVQLAEWSTSLKAPRCHLDAGLAVADNGARVYIVGGWAQLSIGLEHPCITPHDTSAPWISAEVFELDLGERLMGSDPLSPTARWRQVCDSAHVRCISAD